MADLTEEEKEILRRAKAIQRKVEEDIDRVPDDFGEPVKKKKRSSRARASERRETPQGKLQAAPASQRKKQAPAPRRQSRTRRLGIFLWKCILVLLILLAVLYAAARHIAAKVDYQTYETSYVRASNVMSQRGVKNILVIGTDERHSDDTTRSDAMILLTINERTRKIMMTSILRDCYVPIEGHGENRINAAYQFGGAALTVQTVEETFQIAIDGYVKIDFYSFVDIVDAVGGVWIDVSEEEREYVNGYLNEINTLLGAEFGDGYLQSSGVQLLGGKQALSYARIRYIGSDFQRTQRQREVIEGIIQQVKKLNPTQLYRLTDTVLPKVVTNLDDHTLACLMMKAVFYMGYDVEQNRIPLDGTWSNATIDGKAVLLLDFAANVQGIQQAIYRGEEDGFSFFP